MGIGGNAGYGKETLGETKEVAKILDGKVLTHSSTNKVIFPKNDDLNQS